DLEVSAIFIARSGIPIDGQIAVLWLMGHCIVDCRMVHGDADDRVLRHIFHTMAAEVHHTSITQTFLVLLDCSSCHPLSSPRTMGIGHKYGTHFPVIAIIFSG